MAIILVIVVPKIMGVINESRESARNSTKEIYYKAVQRALYVRQTLDEPFEDGLYTLNENKRTQLCHNTSCFDVEVDADDNNLPESVEVTIENWKIKAGTFKIKLPGETEVTVFLEDGSMKKNSKVNEDYLKAVQEAIVAYNATSPSASPDGDYYVDDNGNLVSVLVGEEDRILTSADADILARNKGLTVNTIGGAFPSNAFIKISNSTIVASQFSDEEPICRFIPDERAYKKSDDGRKIFNIRKGAKYLCQVSDTESYEFYVVSNNDTEENGNDNFDLMLNVATLNNSYRTTWGSSLETGPTALLTKIYDITKDWTNIPYINFNSSYYSQWSNFKDSGSSYGELTITDGVIKLGSTILKDNNNNVIKTRARALSLEDTRFLNCGTGTSCISWVNNESGKYKTIWLYNTGGDGATYILGSNKGLSTNTIGNTYHALPVISLPKTAMDWGNNITD